MQLCNAPSPQICYILCWVFCCTKISSPSFRQTFRRMMPLASLLPVCNLFSCSSRATPRLRRVSQCSCQVHMLHMVSLRQHLEHLVIRYIHIVHIFSFMTFIDNHANTPLCSTTLSESYTHQLQVVYIYIECGVYSMHIIPCQTCSDVLPNSKRWYAQTWVKSLVFSNSDMFCHVPVELEIWNQHRPRTQRQDPSFFCIQTTLARLGADPTLGNWQSPLIILCTLSSWLYEANLTDVISTYFRHSRSMLIPSILLPTVASVSARRKMPR